MPEIYRSQHAGSIADLLRQRGASAASRVRTIGDLEAQRAVASGQAIQGITQGVTGTLRDYAQQRQEAPRMALAQQQADHLAAQLSAMRTEEAQKKIGELASMVRASNYDPATAEPVFRAIAKLSPDYEQPLLRSLMEPDMLKNVTDTLISQTPGYKAPEGFTLSEGQTRFDPSGKQVANVPKPEPVAQPFTLGEGQVRYNPDGSQVATGPTRPEPATPNVTESQLAFMAAQGNTQAAAALERLRSLRDSPPAERNPIPVIGDDGQPVYMLPNQAVGRRPASNREQGRPVASGDANRIADFDTSLDDVDVLGRTLTETTDATGVTAAAGAALPNWVTDLTGWGTNAKKRQGVIDRVKQVIGKALEGGVLRKEDEAKYSKILPTISDTPEVAASKLQGLKEALVQRRQTLLDALEDSGYDTSRFKVRKSSSGGADDRVEALIKKYGGGG